MKGLAMDNKPSPLEILVSEFLPAAEAAAVETQVQKIQEPPGVTALGDLRAPVYGNDPSELLKHRFLYRGAVCLLCGPTGVGKSALLMQAAIYWSVGRAFFGILPGEIYQQQGMRILMVQAENDEGDLVEMRDGVLAGCDDLSDEEKALARQRVKVKTVCDKSAEAFAVYLDALLTENGPFDLVMVDPAFAYLGGDSNSQKDVSHFMRELMNPLLQKHEVGMVLAHHTNKPLRGKEKDSWAAGDFAYLGAGSAEWINPARAALAIRSIGSDSVFEFRAVKRGKRLRWVDANGSPTTAQFIAHDERPGVICWHVATAEAVEELAEGGGKGGRRKQYKDFECVHAVKHRPGESRGFYMDLIAGRLECGKTTVRRMLDKCTQAGWIVERGDQQFRRYEVTEKGLEQAQRRPSATNWVP
jgi:hypothetical protein